MPLSLPPVLQRLIGFKLPIGSYTITESENHRVCNLAATQAAQDGSAHPIFPVIATLAGMGLSIAKICDLCEFDIADGPMVGVCNVFNLGAPIAVGDRFDVAARISGMTRKPSRRFGQADHLTLTSQLSKAGLSCSAVELTWILPRSRVL